jgi:hypothetical protein
MGLLLDCGHAHFESREIGHSHDVGHHRSHRRQPDRFGGRGGCNGFAAQTATGSAFCPTCRLYGAQSSGRSFPATRENRSRSQWSAYQAIDD